ncbi:sedoheptulose-1,7-bisphosphatase [Chloropicon primus]|uniref:Sedoheptulose-1,7-bisphosphatase, chloroplastic n=1 Tax=Chloropicon primus TaxID=1764295 RepID=A0A5B8MNM2_9CHLO|nr:sedoheptulose-1,7-bisphosphatase [Chloropicon primus]UPR01484.1 sedoheptulose-1,7-bisphosphatase [Chloropicon primus]|mmetsp:Transcript_5376/g.16224  ORF Transcript_5376/g.16224 Transcript_5376/m.16224 type:complete len:393 (+) Transcript_5376:85-1263(+)|eukprot:QDZ22268.1 sedoheptulose-1,7-bisphosphatase [Chloropicon primus]
MIGAKSVSAGRKVVASTGATAATTTTCRRSGASRSSQKKALLGSVKCGFKGVEVSKASRGAARRAMRAQAARAEVGDTLEEFLEKSTDDKKLRTLMLSMGEAIRTIAFKVRTASCGATACVNSFGDEQLAVDLLADKILFETLKFSGCCELACSEEVPEPLQMGGEGFSVAFDPLDGSSIVDTNFSVGTIFGVWPGGELTNVTGRDQAAAAMGVYGPRTVYCLALKDAPGCHEFLLQDDGKFVLVKTTTQIKEGKMFSPGNLRATADNPEYAKLVNYWIDNQYTLRYTGGMVPDVFQIIVKEKGVFSNVISPSTKAKLRLLFEVAPLALLVEKAGGASSCDGKCVSGLDVNVDVHDQRTQICYGSVGEVKRFEETLYGKSERFAEVTENVTA